MKQLLPSKMARKDPIIAPPNPAVAPHRHRPNPAQDARPSSVQRRMEGQRHGPGSYEEIAKALAAALGQDGGEIQRLMGFMQVAEEACRSSEEVLGTEQVAKSEKKRVWFTCSSFHLLTTPHIGIKNSEDACFKTIRALDSANECCNKLKQQVVNGSAEDADQVKQTLNQVIEVLEPKCCGMNHYARVVGMFRSIIQHEKTQLLETPLRSLVETGIRFSLRKMFNTPVVRVNQHNKATIEEIKPDDTIVRLEFDGDQGTYEFNGDDVASLIRDALMIRHEFKGLITTTLSLEGEERLQEVKENIQFIHVYAAAHDFLNRVFIENEPVIESIRKHPTLVDSFSVCCEIATKLGMEEQAAFLIGDFTQLIKELQVEQTIVQALRMDMAAIELQQTIEWQQKPRRGKAKRKAANPKPLYELFRFPMLRSSLDPANCPQCSKLVLDNSPGGSIGCDGCDKWFHLRCLNLKKNYPKTVDMYYCPNCSNKAQNL